jgi:exoribonuclease-2
VTGVSDKGTWARLIDLPVEGRVVSGFEGADVGDRIDVVLVAIDVQRGFIDFTRVPSFRGSRQPA